MSGARLDRVDLQSLTEDQFIIARQLIRIGNTLPPEPPKPAQTHLTQTQLGNIYNAFELIENRVKAMKETLSEAAVCADAADTEKTAGGDSQMEGSR